MPSLMLITPRLSDPPVGGRELLSRLHVDCLHELLGPELEVVSLDRKISVPSILRQLAGYIDGVSPDVVAHLRQRVAAEGIERVYLNGSNLGRLARSIRAALPKVEILTFFHNVEARFFAGALRTSRTPRGAAVLLANYAAERDAVRFSDRIIALNNRDSDQLKRLYGRSATDIVPMALEDRLDAGQKSLDGDGGDFLLFVGGDFYANVAGIRWFAREVAPHIGLKTRVIGRGLDLWRDELEANGKVEVLGTVDDLQPHYLDAAAVIAPIFDGSGMKTKVAEALMYGKPILGTDEAFRGYEAIASAAGWICNDRAGFEAAAAQVLESRPPRFDRSLRQIYESAFSHSATRSRLANILGDSKAGGSENPGLSKVG